MLVERRHGDERTFERRSLGNVVGFFFKLSPLEGLVCETLESRFTFRIVQCGDIKLRLYFGIHDCSARVRQSNKFVDQSYLMWATEFLIDALYLLSIDEKSF